MKTIQFTANNAINLISPNANYEKAGVRISKLLNDNAAVRRKYGVMNLGQRLEISK